MAQTNYDDIENALSNLSVQFEKAGITISNPNFTDLIKSISKTTDFIHSNNIKQQKEFFQSYNPEF